jgi:hypothetical protein
MTPDDTVAREIEITEYDGTDNETAETALIAPAELGEYRWSVLFPAQVQNGILHEEDSEPFWFTVRPHMTSMAVWDVPTPVVLGASLDIKIGAKCDAQCSMEGQKFAVYDHEDVKVASGTLGGDPWPRATALYWTELQLQAPKAEGLYRWTVKLEEPDLPLAHQVTSYSFVFRTVKQPERVVTVKVLDTETREPVEEAVVLLHPYRAKTDVNGLARIEVAQGEYELNVTKGNYGLFQLNLTVDRDVRITADVLVVPPEEMGTGS